MGFSIGSGFQSMLGAGQNDARANTRLSKVNAETSTALRQASNAAEAAQGNLARFVQSVNNNKLLDAGGTAQEALVVNSLRGSDAQMGRSLSDDIKDAEQAGHAAAYAAAAGVDGNVVDMVNQSTALRNSIVDQSVAEHQAEANYDVSRRAGNIFSQMVGGLDSSVIMDRLDYNRSFVQQSPSLSLFARTLQGFFPAQGDGVSGFRNLADAGYSKIKGYFGPNGQTSSDDTREANTFSFKQQNFGDNYLGGDAAAYSDEFPEDEQFFD